jgi:hypothetical protein
MLTDKRGKGLNNGMTDNGLSNLLDAIDQLQKIGKTLHKRYEDNCNGDISETDIDEEGTDTVAAKLQKQADAIAANVGLYVYHQTDPRGWPLYVSYSAIPDNDYNRAATGIDCHLNEDYDGPTTE